MALAALLTLADSRLPAGGHVHSAGVEQAIAARLVHDEATLGAYLLRRLRTTGLVTAALAAATTHAATDSAPTRHPPTPGDHARVADLDAEADARTPSPAQRGASRAQGRGLLRAGRRAWPDLRWALLGDAPHHPLALGVAAAAAGLGPADAALAAAYASTTSPATAAQRLLALDPVGVAALTASLAPAIDAVADQAVRAAYGPLGGLPADSDPLLDLLAERHAAREDTLFAS